MSPSVGCGKMAVHHAKAINAHGAGRIIALTDPSGDRSKLDGLVPKEVPFFTSAADLLKAVFDANLNVQHMDGLGAKLVAAGFAYLGQTIDSHRSGDVAVSGSCIAIHDGRTWVAPAGPCVLRPPYRIYRRAIRR